MGHVFVIRHVFIIFRVLLISLLEMKFYPNEQKNLELEFPLLRLLSLYFLKMCSETIIDDITIDYFRSLWRHFNKRDKSLKMSWVIILLYELASDKLIVEEPLKIEIPEQKYSTHRSCFEFAQF